MPQLLPGQFDFVLHCGGLLLFAQLIDARGARIQLTGTAGPHAGQRQLGDPAIEPGTLLGDPQSVLGQHQIGVGHAHVANQVQTLLHQLAGRLVRLQLGGGQQARRRLANRRLAGLVQSYVEGADPGVVVSQFPRAGRAATRNMTVRLVVSRS